MCSKAIQTLNAGCAKIFVASYERDKVFAFAFQGIGEEAEEL